MEMLDLNEMIGELAGEIRVHCYGHAFRRADGHDL